LAVDKEFSELKEWLIIFVKHKDIFHKKIKNISEDGHIVIVEQKDTNQYFAILPNLEKSSTDQFLEKYKDQQLCFVVFNTKNNLDVVIKNWQKFSKLPMLSIYFVNPNSNTDKRWIIYPFTHSKITESSALKLGLQTLFESVDEYK
jgi:hypothetical protein